MRGKKGKQTGKLVRDWAMLAAIVIFVAILIVVFPEKKGPVTTTAWDFFLEMIMILPAVMVLMGLFSVFISRELVVKYLGKTSGTKGIFVAILFGALPTGPLYVAFPLASALIKKGASISNIVIFLSAWACIKIPQEMVELQFLGFGFMATRLILTIILVAAMGFFIERVVEWGDKKMNKSKKGEENNAGI
ncbi:permease [Candidatus Aerophobetes bacterium]|nr:permease [Candidatus Aerophobetes bacterium]